MGTSTHADRFYAARNRELLRRRRMAARSLGARALNMPPPPLPLMSPDGVVMNPEARIDTYVSHPEVGLSPSTVISIYRQAELGWCDSQADLFAGTIENDGHLQSVIMARQLAVAGKSWQLNAGDDSPDAIAAAKDLEDALREVNIDDLITWILGARYYGYSGSEIVWKSIDGVTVPKWFINIPFRRFRFSDAGEPLFRNSRDIGRGDPLEPGKWCFATNQGSLTTNTPRCGLMRGANWYSMFKRWSWRDWTIYAEKFGIPLVLGKYPEGATEVEIDRVEDAVENIGEDGQATMPDDIEIEIRESQRMSGGEGLHGSIVKEANTEMSKLITGSTLLVESGGAGSFALGKVHQTRAFDLVLADAKMVADLFARHIAAPFMAWNGLTGVKKPRLQIHVAQETDPLTRAKIADTLQQMGLSLDTEQLRSEFQFRAPPSDERTLQRPEENTQESEPSK